MTELATGNYENRLAIVKNLPKLPATEHLTGVDNYDGWNTKMRRFFAAFDVMEYAEKPLAEIKDTRKIKNQLDAAILLAIHKNISTDLQQVVNNEVHTYEAWETLRKLYMGNTVQELINIGTKLLELAFNPATLVPTFFAEAEAGFLKLHRIGYTVPERIKSAFLLQKIYPRLPATAASITALPDEQITVRYIQEKVIKAVVDLLAHNKGELGETGDPRPTSGNSSQRLVVGYEQRLAITDGSSRGRRQTSGTGRGMTIGDSSGDRQTTTLKRCLRCFARDHEEGDCPKPDTRRCYTCNLTGHISRNCPRYGDRGKMINTIIKSKYELRPILDTGVVVSLVPDGTYLRYATNVNTDKTVRLTDSKTLRLGYKGTLNLIWENGDRLTLNEVYMATGIKDIIISLVQLIERQGLICVINENGTYLCSERRKDGDKQELEHDGGVI